MDSVHVSELPPDLTRPLPLGRRVLLIAEIVAIYCRVRVGLWRERFPDALAGARGHAGARGGHGHVREGAGDVRGGHGHVREGAGDVRGGPGDVRDCDDGGSAVTYLRAARFARAVQRTLRVVPLDGRCLMQSLVLTAVLARRGIDTKLLIGVNQGGEFEAHAWVEYCGRALLPDSQGEYHMLAEL